jgi:hypothetical protein
MSSFIIKSRESTITDNGQRILYGLKPNSTPANIQKIKNFFSKRIYKNEQLVSAPGGLYTWILKQDGSFYASKTFSKQELGTLHINLKMLTNNNSNTDVIAAGELELIDEGYGINTVLFNLLSGTFMASKLKKNSYLRNELIRQVETVLMGFGIPSSFLECMSCSEEERIGGMKLIETALIKTSPKKVAILNELFYRRGGTQKAKKNRFKKTRRHIK